MFNDKNRLRAVFFCFPVIARATPEAIQPSRHAELVSASHDKIAGQARNDSLVGFWIASPYRVRNDAVRLVNSPLFGIASGYVVAKSKHPCS
jgi:hypothetical protein